jgi:hypothetical protein
MDDWAKRKLAELRAATPAKRKKAEPFVKVPLWWAVEAAKATNTAKALVWIELLHASWKAKSLTFPLPNGRLKKAGVSRFVKYRVLRELEKAKLITVKWRHGKSAVVTLVVL